MLTKIKKNILENILSEGMKIKYRIHVQVMLGGA